MKKILQGILALLVLVFLSVGLYYLLREIWQLFKSIDSTLAAGMVAASATVLVSVITLILSKRQEHKAEISSQLRVKKIPIYEKIIEFIFLITFADKLGKKQPSEKEMIRFFADTTRDLVIWGSSDMVKAFGDFREEIMDMEHMTDTRRMLSTVEDLLFAVRKDLGHKHTSLVRGDILRLYINDIPDYFPKT